jgi:signal transduction histidine kinase
VKFTPKGGRVEVRTEAGADAVVLTVTDTGRGFDAAFAPHVFEPFRQADSSTRREHGGLGLGLSIARHLVELHGGTITAASDGPGRGATFTVTLPVARAPEIASTGMSLLGNQPSRAAVISSALPTEQ